MEFNSKSNSTMCAICANLFASPEALRRFADEGGASLCRGRREETQCLLRQITFLCIDKFNEDEIKIREDNPEVTLFDYGGVIEATRSWSDFSRIDLRCHRGEDEFDVVQSFVVCTPADDPAAPFVTTQPPNYDLGATSLNTLQSWIRDCSGSHEHCPKPDSSWLPTRVLDVGKAPVENTADLKLHTVNGELENYTALSYCWGGPQEVALTQASLADKHNLITLASLPQTIQDAIIVTRLLGVRFLWVDALCIIQDSDDDKSRELSMMDRVYKNSFITISAASASTCYEGFLQPRLPPPKKHQDLTFVYRCKDNEPSGTVILTEDHWYDPRLEPINSRAWTYQERILAPRLLIYGTSQMRWQCQKMDISYGGLSRTRGSGSERLEKTFFAQQPAVTEEDQDWALDNWQEILFEYTRRSLSFASDKLVAVAAVASLFQPYCGTYLAGLWTRPRFVEQLCWMVDQTVVRQILLPRTKEYVAPSWSWASTQNNIVSVSSSGETVAVVEHCETVPLMKDFPFGAVISGLLILRAPFRTCILKLVGDQFHLEGTLRSETTTTFSEVWMDAEEDRCEQLWCLRPTTECFGILLTLRRDGKYSRVGVVYQTKMFEAWFESAEVGRFKIV